MTPTSSISSHALLEIKTAVRSKSDCSDKTVQRLRALLQFPENGQSLLNSVPDSRQRSTKKTTAGPTTKRSGPKSASQSKTVEIFEDKPSLLSEKQCLGLATDVVNSALQALGDTVRSQGAGSSANLQGEQAKSEQSSKGTSRSRPHVLSKPNRVVQEVCSNRCSTSPSDGTGAKNLPGQSSRDGVSMQGLEAVIECACIAFEYLRKTSPIDCTAQDPSEWQIENGMIAFVGKLVALRFGNVAAKELKYLKKRLEMRIQRIRGLESSISSCSSSAMASTETVRRETLSTLLHFDTVDLPAPFLHFLVTYQILVLRIIGINSRPQVIESVKEHLGPAIAHSPDRLMQRYAQTSGDSERATLVLEQLSQVLLSFCPKLSSTNDASAIDASMYCTPGTSFLLQSMAFRARLTWMTLSDHKGSIEEEIIRPFNKCFATFTRRCQSASKDCYKLAKAGFDALFTDLEDSPDAFTAALSLKSEPIRDLYQQFSHLAEKAGLDAEAQNWLETLLKREATIKISSVEKCTLSCRMAIMNITQSLKDVQLVDLDLLNTALIAMKDRLAGTSEAADRLMYTIFDLRRAAVNFIKSTSDKLHVSGCLKSRKVQNTCRNILNACISLQTEICIAAPGGAFQCDASKVQQRKQLVSRSTRATVESVIFCYIQRNDFDKGTWEAAENGLRLCSKLIGAIGDAPTRFMQTGSAPVPESPSLAVSLCNAYFRLYTKARDLLPEQSLCSLEASCEALLNATPSEKFDAKLIVKLEKLARSLQASERHTSARKTFLAVVETWCETRHIHGGASTSILGSTPSSGSPDPQLYLLRESLRSLLEYESQGPSGLPFKRNFFDNENLQIEDRGMVLEMQLDVLSNGKTSKALSSYALKCVPPLVNTLYELYQGPAFWMHRRRVSLRVLDLATDNADCISSSLLEVAENFATAKDHKDLSFSGTDSDIAPHLKLSLAVALVLRDSQQGEDQLQDVLSEWSRIVDSSNCWAELAHVVDGTDVMERLKSASEYLASKGRPYLQLSASRLAFKIHERRLDISPQGYVKASVDFGLQLLRLGYSELAGIYFAKAQTQLEIVLPCIEEQIDYHLAYAEYFLNLSDRLHCCDHLEKANELFEELESTVSSDTRGTARQAKIVSICRNADFLHLRSSISLENGSFLPAYWFAKQEVTLLQSAWKSLEARYKASRPNPDLVEAEGQDLAEAFSNLDFSAHDMPRRQVASVHGPMFWPLIPRLCKALVHLSALYKCSGLLSDAMCNLDQALQLAEGNTVDHFLASILVQKGDCGSRAGIGEASWLFLDRAHKLYGGSIQIKDAAVLQQSIGHFHHLQQQWKTEIEAYELAESILTNLVHPDFVRHLEGKSDLASALEAAPPAKISEATIAVNQSRKKIQNPAQASKPGRKPKDSPQESPTAQPRSPVEFSSFSKLHKRLRRAKAESLLSQGHLDASARLISGFHNNPKSVESTVEDKLCQSRQLICEATRILSADGIFGMIAESAISFPGTTLSTPRLENGTPLHEPGSKQDNRHHVQAQSRSKTKAESNTVFNFRQLLGQALQELSMKRAITSQLHPLSVLRQAGSAIGTASMMLSSVEPASVDRLLHPTLVAYSTDLPQCIASLRDQAMTYVDRAQKDPHRGLRWFRDCVPANDLPVPEISQFHREFIDCLPSQWTAISISLDESQSHLHLTRYRRNQCAFVLRLPLTRQNAEEPDEESFTFIEAKSELSKIVELSDATVHAAKEDPDGMKKKSAKAQWWAEREALDSRFHDFLLNIENMWLGGFRGIFSQNQHDPQLLARFQHSFEAILQKHLPSRQKSRKRDASSHVKLDPQVLELFVGLAESLEDIDALDETLTDLLYFVVDIFQFNGEANAYDEIDFDSIIIETQDALRSYYEASQAETTDSSSAHTILILDKQLHGFPWESLPCLEKASVSRVYSLIELRERIMFMRQQFPHTYDDAGIVASVTNGTYILNPSSDLKKTQKRFEKQLSSLASPSSGWTAIINRDPTETEFATAIYNDRDSKRSSTAAVQEARNKVLLYFGHGSGTQYIRHRRIKQLRFQSNPPTLQSSHETSSSDISEVSGTKENSLSNSATEDISVHASPPLPNPEISATLLFGCSSASLRQNLEFEPHGTPKSYMLAGAPALLGSLWDVTDGDVDKFAGGVLERWGLFESGAFAEMRREGAKARSRSGAGKGVDEHMAKPRGIKGSAGPDQVSGSRRAMSLTEAVAKSRGDCYLKYLNGAAMVVYGVPVYLAKE